MTKIGIIGNVTIASSKNQLRKCEKGLHEFKESNYTSDKDGMLVTKKEWFCQHCGINMRNRG